VNGRPVVVLGSLTVALLVAVVVSAGMGAFHLAPVDVLGSVLRRVGVDAVGSRLDDLGESVLWEIRFPRLVLTVLVGASLGGAGALMQGTFGNPLAEPGIVGVSSGAVLGAAAQIVIGFAPLGVWTLTGSAFLGGLVTVVAVYLASRAGGRTEVVTLILTGVAVNALAGAVIGLLTFISTDAELRSITFWTLGSVAQATWPKVVTVAPIALGGLALAFTQWRSLDLLALGERPARHLGVDVERVRITTMAVVALLTAAAVAVSGIILFIGLVIPHLVRMVAGPGHRLLLPAAALGGALILVLADLFARTVAEPAEIPLGVVTSLIGSPFFFWQLRRTRARQGGWA
jgi:iron complex transport system permease protein